MSFPSLGREATHPLKKYSPPENIAGRRLKAPLHVAFSFVLCGVLRQCFIAVFYGGTLRRHSTAIFCGGTLQRQMNHIKVPLASNFIEQLLDVALI